MRTRILLALALLFALTLAPSARAAVVKPTKLLVIIGENKTRTQVEKQGPYVTGLSRTYGYATKMTACSHPSLPNYMCLSGGSTFGITDNGSPKKRGVHGQSIFGNATAHGKSWRVYADAMQGNCALVDQGYYAVHHTGSPYYLDERSLCNSFDVPMQGNFAQDVTANRLPNLSWLIGSELHDAHTPSTMADFDNWLKNTVLPSVFASSDFKTGVLAVVVDFDEGKDTNQNVAFDVFHASLSHVVVNTTLTHFDFYRSQLRFGGASPSGTDALAQFGL